MPPPRLAPALDRLRDEVDARWPDRDRRTDGWIGNPAHAARISQHNPDDEGIVRALDIDVDGIDPKVVLSALIGHPGVWYVIHGGRIWSRTYGWQARRYLGSNPHTGHIHVSLLLDRDAAFVAGRWLVRRRPPVRNLRRGDTGRDVARWQRALGVTPDGVFGPATEAAVNRVRARHGWPTSGVIGPRVRKALRPRL